MKGNTNQNYEKHRKLNLVIITKNCSKNSYNRNLITYQNGDVSYKLNINSSRISHDKILKTVSNMKKKFDSKKDEYLNSYKNDKNDKTLIKEEINNDNNNVFDLKKFNKINKKLINPIDYKKGIEGNIITIINKTNSKLCNEFEIKNKEINNFNKQENNEIENKNNNDNNIEVTNNLTIHGYVNNKDNIIPNNASNNNTKQTKIYNNNYIIYNNYYICNNINDIEKNDNASSRKLKNEKFKDNISENKNLINIPNNNLFFSKKNAFSKVNENKEIGNNILRHQQKTLIENDNKKPKIFQNVHSKCFICDRNFLLSRLYVADCKIHFLCRICLKNFYEDKIENTYFTKEDKLLKCPCENCDKNINFNIIKNKISERHLALYLKKINDNMPNKIKDNIFSDQTQQNENIKFYTQKHVIDINSNENFFLYNKAKDIYCTRCLKPTLFTKTNTNFIICLNCRFKMCKLCLKEYQDKHTDIKTNNHCKVFYKKNEFYSKKNKISLFIRILLQYIFIFAIFIIMIIGTFYNIMHITKIIFCIGDKKEIKRRRNIECCWYLKYSLAFIFCVIIYVIILPFMFILFPFFPILISMLNFNC